MVGVNVPAATAAAAIATLYYQDLLAWFLLVVSAVAIVACWLPSARRFAREATSLRNSSPVEVGSGIDGRSARD
jgi:hypothetical protein